MKKITEQSGIKVRVLGASNPFSKTGRSSGYLVSIKGKTFLVDCGAPIFELLTWSEIEELAAVLATHSHDDHRRWFTDLVLFRFYVCRNSPKLKLMTSERIHEQFKQTSKSALEMSLSFDSKQVVDVPYSQFVDTVILGPRAKYYIDHSSLTTNKLGNWRVLDRHGNIIPPSRGKVIINPKTHSQRLLFKDPQTNLWIEPESYYPYNSDVFYEENNIKHIDEAGFTIEVFKSHAWHGLPTVGIKFSTENETVIFSGDTVYDINLFKQLTQEIRELKLGNLSRQEFERAPVIIGDINNYIQKTWSEARYQEAKNMYQSAVVFHDTATVNSVVHTDYHAVKDIEADKVVLVHTPDRFVSTELMVHHDKSYRIVQNQIYEEVNGKIFTLDADIYFKQADMFFVGYANEEGDFKVIEKNDMLLDVIPASEPTEYKELFRVELFQDIQGRYCKYLHNQGFEYRLRNDNKIEQVLTTDEGSYGKIYEPMPRILAPFSPKPRKREKTDTSVRH